MNILEEIQNCPVEWKELGEVVHSIKTGLNPRKFFQLNTTDATNYYITVREIRGHKIVPSEKTDLINNEGLMLCQNRSNLESGDVLFTGTGTIGNVAIIEESPTNWNIKEGVYSIKPKKEIICSKFLMYIFESERVRKDIEGRKAGGTVKSVSMTEMKKIKIPIPPLEIQEKIVQILDKFTDYVTELTSELTSRKKQYSYYRDKLLSFEDEVYQVEWKTLSEIAKDFGRGKSKHRPRNDVRLYGGDIPFIQTGDIREAGKWIENYSQTYSEFGLQQSKQWEKGTLCITIAANIAETGLLGFDACFPDSIIGFVANPEFAITEYVYYYLNSIKDYLANKSYGSAQDNLNLSTFSSLKIPIPSLKIQSRIVQVLDNFDTVCNDLNIGLPKEIELRQKQYEYFREKLLTFVAEGEYTDSTVQTRHH